MLRLLLRCNYFHFSFRRYWRAELAAVCSKTGGMERGLVNRSTIPTCVFNQFYLFISVLQRIKEALWTSTSVVIAECVFTLLCLY
jgi:hypothetical protein